VSPGRWAVQLQTFQLTSTDSLIVPLVAFGSGPSRAEAELPVGLPCIGTVQVFLLGVSVPTKRFQFAIHLEGEEAQPAQAPDDNNA